MLPSDDLDLILTKVGKDWEFLRGRNIFITGGTGFFGIWLLESFARANDVLGLRAIAHVLTRNPETFVRKCPHLGERSDIVLHRGEIRNFEFPAGAFPFIIHAAVDTSSRSSSDSALDAFHTIIDGTRRVLDFAATTKVEKLFFVSSGAVYGGQPPDLHSILEDYPGAPDPFLEASFYGEAKRASEWLCAAHARAHGYVMNSARCFAFVGPHLPLDGPYAVGNFIRDALEGYAPRITGGGNAMRSYLYTADLAVWLWRILFAGHGGRAYNVGSDQPFAIRDLAAMVAAAGKIGMPPPADSAAPATRYIPDTTRARTELGLHAWTPLPEALRKTIAWLRQQPSSQPTP
jgi:nucleoside-diphosphate-sugar epimerase